MPGHCRFLPISRFRGRCSSPHKIASSSQQSVAFNEQQSSWPPNPSIGDKHTKNALQQGKRDTSIPPFPSCKQRIYEQQSIHNDKANRVGGHCSKASLFMLFLHLQTAAYRIGRTGRKEEKVEYHHWSTELHNRSSGSCQTLGWETAGGDGRKLPPWLESRAPELTEPHSFDFPWQIEKGKTPRARRAAPKFPTPQPTSSAVRVRRPNPRFGTICTKDNCRRSNRRPTQHLNLSEVFFLFFFLLLFLLRKLSYVLSRSSLLQNIIVPSLFCTISITKSTIMKSQRLPLQFESQFLSCLQVRYVPKSISPCL